MTLVMVVDNYTQYQMLAFACKDGHVTACDCCAEDRAALVEQGILYQHPQSSDDYVLTPDAFRLFRCEGTA